MLWLLFVWADFVCAFGIYVRAGLNSVIALFRLRFGVGWMLLCCRAVDWCGFVVVFALLGSGLVWTGNHSVAGAPVCVWWG